MKLIIGLGNPGKEYENTRHNCGFMVIDALSKQFGIAVDQTKFKGLYGKGTVGNETVILLKPQTYMNLSGESVQELMNFYKINKEDVLVIYDDLDLPVGKIRVRASGSAGGHNGVKSLIAHMNGQDFKRIRVGIDRNSNIPVVNYVLGKFTKEEFVTLQQAIDLSCKVCSDFLTTDFHKVMSLYNQK